jgi:hypothetical protein
MEKNKIRDQVVEEVSTRLANLIKDLTDETYGKVMGNMPIALGDNEKLFLKQMILDSVISEVFKQLHEKARE